MKKTLSIIITALMLSISSSSYAQISLEGILDNVVNLASKKSEGKEIANLLSSGVSMLEKEANAGNSDMRSKLLGQVGALKGLIPLATAGKLELGSLSKIVNTVKMLIAANRLKSMLGGGKSSLLGNGAGILKNLDLLKAGSAVLGSGLQNKFGKLLSSTTKSVGKLDKSGLFGKFAASATDKKLGKLIGLVTSAL